MTRIKTDRKSATRIRAFDLINWSASSLLLIIFCIGAIGLACGNQKPISKTERAKFTDVYVDLTLAYWKSERAPERYQSLAAAVYQKYNIDKTFLINARTKIENNPKLQYDIYQDIANRLKAYDDIPPESLSKVLNSVIDTK
jgi:hypothetical protein